MMQTEPGAITKVETHIPADDAVGVGRVSHVGLALCERRCMS